MQLFITWSGPTSKQIALALRKWIPLVIQAVEPWRALWELHTAYYYGGLSLLGAWQSGYESYAHGATGARHRIPIDGWFMHAGYLLTGETIRDRTLIDPLHPFDLRKSHFGLGAFELTTRYSALNLACNQRLLQALAVVDDPTPAYQELARLTEPSKSDDRSYAGFNPARQQDLKLFGGALRF